MTAPIYITFVINGEEAETEGTLITPLRTCVEDVLDAMRTLRPVSDWELRYGSGELIPPDKYDLPISAFGFEKGAVLFLTLRVGAGG